MISSSNVADNTMLRSLRIATFNLENFGGETEASQPLAQRRAALLPLLLPLQADILCLQEVNGQRMAGAAGRRLAALDRLLDGTPYAAYERAWTKDADGKGALDVHNLVILSRFPIGDTNQIQNSLVAGPIYRPVTVAAGADRVRWDRPIIHAALRLPGGKMLHVVNLHLRAPLATFLPGQKQTATMWKSVSGWAEGFFISAMKRSGQALEARLFVDGLFQSEADPLVAVCGDFNSEAREMPMRIIRGDPADSGNSALADQALVPLENSAHGVEIHSVLHNGRRLLLDHILVSKTLALACRSVTIDNKFLADEAHAVPGGQEIPGSYHAPVVASFEIL